MAKKSRVNRNEVVKQQCAKYKAQRDALRVRSKDLKCSLEERMEARAALDLLPTNSSPTRYRVRCQVTGRSRGNLRRFGICRNALRLLAHQGVLPGVKKASW
ncbi:MAG: 30S ribosomal protein S14 [Planctomycetes bacterium]|jgi:small subunit ribosomal protein S14|nr:30S ribosomal protein S14 [Planctomycetota bacterium]